MSARTKITRFTYLLTAGLLVLALLPFSNSKASALSGSDFRADRIIDDHVFFDGNTLGTGDIQAFLNSKVPQCDTNGQVQIYDAAHNDTVSRRTYSERRGVTIPFTCLKDYQQNIPARGPDAYCSGSVAAGTKSAAQIIKDVADACSISPKIILILLQKEQSLITDDWPWPVQYEKATGFACPDTAPCDAEFAGFFNQVYYGARQYQRYAKLPQEYGYRFNRANYIQYHPNANCGGTNVFIQNQATAGLYNYTPYQPNQAALSNLYGTGDGCSAYGNRNFWRMYNDWFGSPVSSHCFFGGATPVITGVTFRKYAHPRMDQGNFVIYSGSSTNCIESHTWQVGVTSWASNVATNHPIALPDSTQVHYGDLNGDGIDEPILIGVNNTGSGKMEFHIWNVAMNKWQTHITSEVPAGNLNNGKILLADPDGDKKDNVVIALTSGTGSGKIEFHVLNSDMRTWMWHVATQVPSVASGAGTVAFGDIDGNGVDEPILILYQNTGSGRVEFHTWNPGWWSWRYHTASNLESFNPLDSIISFADVDGNGVDEGVMVGLRNTGSGKIEFHTWQLGVQAWRFNTVSNQAVTP